jgi:hypothetical protein
MATFQDYHDALVQQEDETLEAHTKAQKFLKQIVQEFQKKISAPPKHYSLCNGEDPTTQQIKNVMQSGDGPQYSLCAQLTVHGSQRNWIAYFLFKITITRTGVVVRVGETSKQISIDYDQQDQLKLNQLNDFLDGLSKRTLNEIENARPNALPQSTHIDYPADPSV